MDSEHTYWGRNRHFISLACEMGGRKKLKVKLTSLFLITGIVMLPVRIGASLEEQI